MAANGQVVPQMTPMQQQLLHQQQLLQSSQASRMAARPAPPHDYASSQSPQLSRPASSLANGHPSPNYAPPAQQQNLVAQQAAQSAQLAAQQRQRYEDLLRSQQSNDGSTPSRQLFYQHQQAQQALLQAHAQHSQQLQAYHRQQIATQQLPSAFPPQSPAQGYQNRPTPPTSNGHARHPSEPQPSPTSQQPLSVAQQRTQQESIMHLQDQQSSAIIRQNRERQERAMQQQRMQMEQGQNGGVGGPRTAAGVAQQYELQRQRQMQYHQQQQQQSQQQLQLQQQQQQLQQQQRIDPRSRRPFPNSHPTPPPPPSVPGLMDYSYRGDLFDRITKRSLAINRFAQNDELLAGIFDRWSVEDVLDGSKRKREEGAEAAGKRKCVEGGFLGEGLREEREIRERRRRVKIDEEVKTRKKLAAETKAEESDETKVDKGKRLAEDDNTATSSVVPSSKPIEPSEEESKHVEEPLLSIPNRREFLLAMQAELIKETMELERQYAEAVSRISQIVG